MISSDQDRTTLRAGPARLCCEYLCIDNRSGLFEDPARSDERLGHSTVIFSTMMPRERYLPLETGLADSEVLEGALGLRTIVLVSRDI